MKSSVVVLILCFLQISHRVQEMKQTNEHIYTQTRTHTQYGILIKCTFQARAHSILPQVINSFVMSFLSSSCRHRTKTRRTFAKLHMWNFYENLIHLLLTSDKYNRHFTLKRKYIYDILYKEPTRCNFGSIVY